MTFEPNQIIYDDDNFSLAADWCRNNGEYHTSEIEPDSDGRRRFQITPNPKPTAEELAEQERQRQAAEAEAQRIPDLEDATLDLASYIAELEERIANLEANNG